MHESKPVIMSPKPQTSPELIMGADSSTQVLKKNSTHASTIEWGFIGDPVTIDKYTSILNIEVSCTMKSSTIGKTDHIWGYLCKNRNKYVQNVHQFQFEGAKEMNYLLRLVSILDPLWCVLTLSTA